METDSKNNKSIEQTFEENGDYDITQKYDELEIGNNMPTEEYIEMMRSILRNED